MTGLASAALSAGYHKDHPVVRDATISIPSGAITAFVGPNGSGKSTLLRALGRILQPLSGTVTIHGDDLKTLDTLEIARTLGVLPQSPVAPDGLCVRDLVLLGRSPHHRWWQTATGQDRDIAEQAMRQAEVLHYADVEVNQLSGGQRQRAWVALLLAQQTPFLLLDEPTTFLDLAHQLEVLSLLRQLRTEQGRTLVLVLHDLNHAAQYADYIFMMKGGEIIYSGTPEQMITPERIREIFRVDCRILVDPETHRRYCIPTSVVSDAAGAGHGIEASGS